jgi:peptide deformylase
VASRGWLQFFKVCGSAGAVNAWTVASHASAAYHALMQVDPSALKIVHYPHPALREKAQPVETVTDHVREVARRMLQLMHDADGVGLAAPQVALPWRMFVTNAREADPEDRVYINPVLHRDPLQRLEEAEEGCLSLPGINVQVRRPACCRITATGLDGRPFEMEDAGFLSRVWQHENDHLDGVLIIDKMSPMDRLATRRTLKELKAAAQG